jgi:hypothetical protein
MCLKYKINWILLPISVSVFCVVRHKILSPILNLFFFFFCFKFQWFCLFFSFSHLTTFLFIRFISSTLFCLIVLIFITYLFIYVLFIYFNFSDVPFFPFNFHPPLFGLVLFFVFSFILLLYLSFPSSDFFLHMNIFILNILGSLPILIYISPSYLSSFCSIFLLLFFLTSSVAFPYI